jgi:hypothetical protein
MSSIHIVCSRRCIELVDLASRCRIAYSHLSPGSLPCILYTTTLASLIAKLRLTTDIMVLIHFRIESDPRTPITNAPFRSELTKDIYRWVVLEFRHMGVRNECCLKVGKLINSSSFLIIAKQTQDPASRVDVPVQILALMHRMGLARRVRFSSNGKVGGTKRRIYLKSIFRTSDRQSLKSRFNFECVSRIFARSQRVQPLLSSEKCTQPSLKFHISV